MNIFKTVLLFAICTHVQSLAQVSDSVRLLKGVEVSAPRLEEYSAGSNEVLLDSALLERYSSGNLSDILAGESQVFVKSYGSGSLATTSFRGAGAAHTAILWNGFNLQSPMNGLLDVALVPVSFLDNVRLQYGAGGATWGSGAVGGSIHLNNSPSYGAGFSSFLQLSSGSFSDQQQQAGIENSSDRFISSLRVFRHSAENDFEFRNTAKYGFPIEKQTNAELLQYGLLQENYFRISKRQELNSRFWYQFNDRNIPPSMTQNVNLSRQSDEAFRVSAEWKRSGPKLSTQARFAYFDEFVQYDDPMISLYSFSETRTLIAEAEARFPLTKLDLLNLGLNNTYSAAFANDFTHDPRQERFSVFGNYKIYSPGRKWNAVLSGRQEFTDGKALPFAPSLGIQGELLRYFQLKASVARHYRIPTFNDLYWAQGGNPQLEPESGWAQEAGILHKHARGPFRWMLAATAFNRNISNWIIWLPGNNGLWTPDNVLEVWSRGVEYRISTAFTRGKFNIGLEGNYNYILSTNERTAPAYSASIGKQLIYVPIQNAQGSLTISWKNSSITYTQVYTGFRYTTSDNAQFLNPYTLGSLDLSQSLALYKLNFRAFVRLGNVWHERYQIMAYRPMPEFQLTAGLNIRFKNPLKIKS